MLKLVSEHWAAAIDRYMEEELPKKRDGGNHRYTLPYWKEQIGHLKLSEITPAIIVEYRGKLACGTYNGLAVTGGAAICLTRSARAAQAEVADAVYS